MILHQENGKIYGLYSKYLEDRSQVNQKGIFYIEGRGDAATKYFKIQYKKERVIREAVLKVAAKEKDFRYYIGGKKVSEKKFEKWWGESMTQWMPRWK